MKIKLKFNWHDRWIGSYDEIRTEKTISEFDEIVIKQTHPAYNFTSTVKKFHHYWICIIPCLPIHIWWEVIQSDNQAHFQRRPFYR